MPRASALPERLRYLQPFRRKFASLPPEELHEDSGSAPLFALFTKRIKGRTLAEAAKLLEGDWVTLQAWLSEPAQSNDCLHFALGVFLVSSPAELAKRLLEEAQKPPEPRLRLHMDLPSGAKLRRVAGADETAMLVSWQGLLFCFEALPEEVCAKLDQAYATVGPRVELVVSSVRFGEITGIKRVKIAESWRGPCKEVEYRLAVPGGHVFGAISVGPKVRDELNWDESKVEAFLHTLRVVIKLPSVR